MNNSLVAEDKLKFPCQVGSVAANHEVLAFVEVGNRGVLRLRHLYDQSLKDITMNYEQQPIQDIYLSHLNYLVVVNAQKQIDVSLVRAEDGSMKIVPIQSFKKSNMMQVHLYDRWLIATTNSSIDIYEYKGVERANKYKFEVASFVKHLVMVHDNIYTYSADGRVRQYNVYSMQQGIPGKQLFVKEGIQALEVVSIEEKDYLVVVGEDSTVEVLPAGQGDLQQMQFEGQFRRLLVRNNLIDVITYSDKIEKHHLSALTSTADGTGVVIRQERYERTAAGCYWLLLNVFTSEVQCYLKRKTSAPVKAVAAVSQETTSLLYVLSTADRTKMDVFRILHNSFVEGQPATTAKLPNPIKLEALVEQVVGPKASPTPLEKKKSEPVPNPVPIPAVALFPQKLQQKKSSGIVFVSETPVSSPQPAKEKKSESVPPKVHHSDMSLSSQVSHIIQSNTFQAALEKMIEVKLQPVLFKINQIDLKVQSLQRRLQSMDSTNSKELKQYYQSTLQAEVLGLFESKMMPKLDEYFKGLFVDLGKVFEQGITYYNNKLNIESDIHRNAFEQLIQHTFKTTNEVIEQARQEFEGSYKIQQLLDGCARAKEEIIRQTQELLGTARSAVGKLEDIVPKDPPKDPPREDLRRKSHKWAPPM